MLDRNSINKVILIGNLGSDPEVREVGGSPVANFSLATNETWTDKSGQKQERTQWHRITVWGKLAEVCGRYLSKGKKVYVEGRIGYRDVEKDGVTTRYTDITATSIQFLDSRGGSVDYGNEDAGGGYPTGGFSGNQGGSRPQNRNQAAPATGANPTYAPPMPPPPDDDDIPF